MMESDVISTLRSFNKFTEDDLSRFGAALDFAVLAHDGAFRKGTNIPYIVHPMEAALIAGQLADDIDTVMGAVLHDVVEDTQYTLEDIRNRFGEKIAGLVADESENKRPDIPAEETWRIRKQESLDHFAKASKGARIIAFADKLSNLRTIARDHAAIGDELWQRFNNHDPKDHFWYYGSIGKLTAEFSSSHLWQEYNRLLKEVFGSLADECQIAG